MKTKRKQIFQRLDNYYFKRYKKDYKKILEYLQSRKIKIKYGRSDEFDQDLNIIYLNQNRKNLIDKIHILLHESGHAIIHQSVKSSLFGYDTKLDIFREEIYAWDLGKQLAKNLEIDLYVEKFDKMMYDSLRKYAVVCFGKLN